MEEFLFTIISKPGAPGFEQTKVEGFMHQDGHVKQLYYRGQNYLSCKEPYDGSEFINYCLREYAAATDRVINIICDDQSFLSEILADCDLKDRAFSMFSFDFLLPFIIMHENCKISEDRVCFYFRGYWWKFCNHNLLKGTQKYPDSIEIDCTDSEVLARKFFEFFSLERCQIFSENAKQNQEDNKDHNSRITAVGDNYLQQHIEKSRVARRKLMNLNK